MAKRKGGVYISERPVEGILSWLPFKSLNRFRIVSKRFDAMISSRKFSDKHYKTTERIPYDLSRRKIFVMNSFFDLNTEAFSESSFSLDRFDIINPDILKSSGIKTCISCRGMVCFSITYVSGGPDIFLWDPLKTKSVQVSTRNDWNEDCIFYPMGFGYDSSTDDHKIVIPFELRNEALGDEIQFLVYSLKTKNWTEIGGQSDYGPFTFPYLRSGMYLMGGIHWLGFCRKKRMIMRFSVGCTETELIEPPSYERKQSKTMEMGIVGGCLGVCIGDEGKGVALWILKDVFDEKSWTMTAFIPCSIIPDSICCLMPIFVMENGEAVMLCPVNNELSIYNLQQNKRASLLPANQEPLLDVSLEEEVEEAKMVNKFNMQWPA